jgi:protein transport protein SEC31
VAKPLKKAPAWMKRPVGCSWGFGGRLVSFANTKRQVVDATTGQPKLVDGATISLSQVG